MARREFTIERLQLPIADADVRGLAALLVDAVGSGAAVSFLDTLTEDDAAAWWRRTLSGAASRSVFLAAREDRDIVGTVQLHPAWAPNQPHRGDIAKLMVHRRARGAGLGERLMLAIEAEAQREGLSLLTLDAKAGGPAERLYLRLGWVRVGAIPRFAVDPDGRGYHDTVIFYKDLAGSARALRGC